MTTRADLVIYQGDDYAAAVSVVRADGTPADLTGYTASAQIRRDIADRASLGATFTATITDATAGTLTLSLPASATRTLQGSYVWDMEVASAGGVTTTILAGAVTITGEITRAAVTP